MGAKEYLQQIKKIDTLIRNKSIEVKQAKEVGVDYTYITNGIKQLQKEKAEIIDVIQRLNEAEYDVLHRVYVQGQTLQEVASERGHISYSQAATLHGKALKKVADMVNAK